MVDSSWFSWFRVVVIRHRCIGVVGARHHTEDFRVPLRSDHGVSQCLAIGGFVAVRWLLLLFPPLMGAERSGSRG